MNIHKLIVLLVPSCFSLRVTHRSMSYFSEALYKLWAFNECEPDSSCATFGTPLACRIFRL